MISEDGERSAAYWREKAEEARTMAEAMIDETAKATLEDIATKYDSMASFAEARERLELERAKKRLTSTS